METRANNGKGTIAVRVGKTRTTYQAKILLAGEWYTKSFPEKPLAAAWLESITSSVEQGKVPALKKAPATKPKADNGAGTITERVGKTRTTYQAKILVSGEWYTKSFPNKPDARAWLNSLSLDVHNGKDITVKKYQSNTIGDIINQYLDAHTKLPKNKKNNLERLAVEFKNVTLEKFKTSSLQNWMNSKLTATIPQQKKKQKTHKLYKGDTPKGYSSSTVRKFYYDLRLSLAWHAKMNDYAFNSKPFDEVKPPPHWDNPRERRLEGDELERLLNACNKMYANKKEWQWFIRWQIFSCMRCGETLLTTKDKIFLFKEKPEDSYVFVPKAHQKTRRHSSAFDRYIPVHPEFWKLLEEMQIENLMAADKVFPWSNSTIVAAQFKRICFNAQVDNLTVHDLRHEGISRFFENTNLTDIEISKITGHTELSTLARYANLRPKTIGSKLWNK